MTREDSRSPPTRHETVGTISPLGPRRSGKRAPRRPHPCPYRRARRRPRLAPSDQVSGFALGALGIGAVGFATAGLLLLLEPSADAPDESRREAAVTPRVTSASVGIGAVAVTGTF